MMSPRVPVIRSDTQPFGHSLVIRLALVATPLINIVVLLLLLLSRV